MGKLLILLSLSFSTSLFSQISKPILLDKSVLSGVGLEKVNIKDEPEKDFYQKNLYRGDDLSVYVVSTESWNNKMDNFPFDEFIYMYHGQAFVKPDHGQTQLFNTGDYFFAPKGYTGQWEILAGSNLHYEVSVITTRRADASKIKKKQSHFLLDNSKLSGVQINLEEDPTFTEVLIEGAELTISLSAEVPNKRKIEEPSKEKLIQLLAGQLQLTDANDNKQVFYTGDFVIIPKGFTGEWESAGHGIFKFLVVERTSF